MWKKGSLEVMKEKVMLVKATGCGRKKKLSMFSMEVAVEVQIWWKWEP